LYRGHRPTGIEREQNQVGGAAHPNLFLNVGALYREGDISPAAVFLERSGRPYGGVEGDVPGTIPGGARLNVAAALALGSRVTSFAGLIARPPICRCFEILDAKVQVQRPALLAPVLAVVRAGLPARVPRRLRNAISCSSLRR
jgi:hypothetical protein